MNLASRCRHAMNHADVLKKELAFQQERTLKLEHQLVQTSGGVSGSAMDVGEERGKSQMTKSTHTMTAMTSRSTPQDNGMSMDHELNDYNFKENPQTTQYNNIRNGDDGYDELTNMDETNCELHLTYPNDTTNSNKKRVPNSATNEMNLENKITTSITSRVKSSSSSTNSIINRQSVQVEDKSDVAFGELQSTDFFTAGTYENTLPATPEKGNVNTLTDAFQKFSIPDDEDVIIKESHGSSHEEDSYDAFEASFQTTFPSSFSQASTSEKHSFSLDEVFNESDSFFTIAAATTPTSNISTSSSKKNNAQNEKSKRSSSQEKSLSQKDPTVTSPIDDEFALFPSTFDYNIPSNSAVSTPPSKGRINDKDGGSLQPPSPPSEKEAGGAAARARYKYALTDTDENIAPMDEAQADKLDTTSPSLVLQRLQQRKHREKSNHDNASSSKLLEENGNKSKDALSEEMQRLDDIANGTHSRIVKSASSRKRAVRQPISYAEPALNSKLRRGDVFFQKDDGDNDAKTNS